MLKNLAIRRNLMSHFVSLPNSVLLEFHCSGKRREVKVRLRPECRIVSVLGSDRKKDQGCRE